VSVRGKKGKRIGKRTEKELKRMVLPGLENPSL